MKDKYARSSAQPYRHRGTAAKEREPWCAGGESEVVGSIPALLFAIFALLPFAPIQKVQRWI